MQVRNEADLSPHATPLSGAMGVVHERKNLDTQAGETGQSFLKWKFIEKLRGDGAPLPPLAPLHVIALAWLGGCVAIAVVAGLADMLSLSLVLGSFGASCVLVFGFPDVPFSQPRNVIAGHVLSSLVGLTFLTLCGPQWWAAAFAVGTAIAIMMGTRTVHPPAGSNPVIVFLTRPDWHFLLYPTFAGAVLLVIVALV
jgi:CBS-domain-containing membrane protein